MGSEPFGQGSIDFYRDVPVDVSGVSGAVDVAVGVGFSCALLSDSSVWCWGSNIYGQLDLGSVTDRGTPGPVVGLSGARRLDAGSDRVCAVMQDDTAKCWGNGYAALPTAIDVGGPVARLALGDSHSCAALVSGSVRCRGSNSSGQLGDGTFDSSAEPTLVAALGGVTTVATGVYASCAVSSGAVYCWGGNGYGQLGDGQSLHNGGSAVPTRVIGIG